MHTLMVAFYFLLSLVGCGSFGAHDIVTQASEHGVQVLLSKASITPLQARFSCISSASTRCHYRVYPRECSKPLDTASASACDRHVICQFVLMAGQSVALDDLPENFHFCVGQRASQQEASCGPWLHGGLSS